MYVGTDKCPFQKYNDKISTVIALNIFIDIVINIEF
jgi:hypothetical protein